MNEKKKLVIWDENDGLTEEELCNEGEIGDEIDLNEWELDFASSKKEVLNKSYGRNEK